MTDKDPASVAPGDDWWADVEDVEEAREWWADVPPNPDLEEDLGYVLLELDVLETSNHEKKLMVLPRDEELIRGDSFIVAAPDDQTDLLDMA